MEPIQAGLTPLCSFASPSFPTNDINLHIYKYQYRRLQGYTASTHTTHGNTAVTREINLLWIHIAFPAKFCLDTYIFHFTARFLMAT